jgi:proteasome accessory factor C
VSTRTSGAAAAAAAGSRTRLSRLLNLVPYLLVRPGVEVAVAAADLDVTPDQLRADLELLWMCGLPGYGPGDLIDLAFDDEHVTVTYDAGIDRPLRLSEDEAFALIVALRVLAEAPGAHDRAAVGRALAKIEAAAGDAAVELPVAAPAGSGGSLAHPRDAVLRGRALQITYYTAARDELSERVVDPMRVVVAAGYCYLEAWCRRAGAVRLFRLDRIDSCTELDEPAAPPPHAEPHDLRGGGVFTPTDEQPLITLRIGRWERWITEYYPCESVVECSPERWRVSLRASDLRWARRFVLGLGPGVSVVSPPALVEAVRGEARAALSAYE